MEKRVGLGYGFAGGLMFSASVFNLILPGLTMGRATGSVRQVLLMLAGILLGALFLWSCDHLLKRRSMESSGLRRLGSRREILIFIAMAFHSLPEGVAVGVGYASQETVAGIDNLGQYIALAIALHNVPDALDDRKPVEIAWAFVLGFCLMILVQVII